MARKRYVPAVLHRGVKCVLRHLHSLAVRVQLVQYHHEEADVHDHGNNTQADGGLRTRIPQLLKMRSGARPPRHTYSHVLLQVIAARINAPSAVVIDSGLERADVHDPANAAHEKEQRIRCARHKRGEQAKSWPPHNA